MQNTKASGSKPLKIKIEGPLDSELGKELMKIFCNEEYFKRARKNNFMIAIIPQSSKDKS